MAEICSGKPPGTDFKGVSPGIRVSAVQILDPIYPLCDLEQITKPLWSIRFPICKLWVRTLSTSWRFVGIKWKWMWSMFGMVHLTFQNSSWSYSYIYYFRSSLKKQIILNNFAKTYLNVSATFNLCRTSPLMAIAKVNQQLAYCVFHVYNYLFSVYSSIRFESRFWN